MGENDKACEVVIEETYEKLWESEGDIEDICSEVGTKELVAKEVLEDKCDWLLEEEDLRVDEVIEEHVEQWIEVELVAGIVAWRLVCIPAEEDVAADDESGELVADIVPPTDGIREGCVKLLEVVTLDDEGP